MSKILYLIREPRFVQPSEPLLQIPKLRILFYLFFQVFGITATVGISQTIAAIGFPVLIIALIPLRWNILPKIFTAKELRIMDAPTADNDVVLASLGGKPAMPRDGLEDGDGSPGSSGTANQSSNDVISPTEEDKWSAAEQGVPREGMRERGGAGKEASLTRKESDESQDPRVFINKRSIMSRQAEADVNARVLRD